jgi:hypothetical protein
MDRVKKTLSYLLQKNFQNFEKKFMVIFMKNAWAETTFLYENCKLPRFASKNVYLDRCRIFQAQTN